MRSKLFIVLVLLLVGCKADLGTKTSDSNNATDDHSVVNESSACLACANQDELENNFSLVQFNCNSECSDNCDNRTPEGEPTDETGDCADCKSGCESNNSGELELAIGRCRSFNHCTGLSQ